jgi:hypothetical protein
MDEIGEREKNKKARFNMRAVKRKEKKKVYGKSELSGTWNKQTTNRIGHRK